MHIDKLQAMAVTLVIAIGCDGGQLLGQVALFTQTGEHELERALESVPDSRQKANVEKTLQRFRRSEITATRNFLKAVDSRAEHVNASSIGLSADPILKQAADLKLWIRSGGVFPSANDFLDLTFAYASSVATAREKLKRPLIALVKATSKTDETLAGRLENAFSETGRVLNLKEEFRIGSHWRGHRSFNQSKHRASIMIVVEKVVGDDFSGRAERDYRYAGHPIYNLAGKLDGARFIASTGTKRAINSGSDGQWHYQGFIFGRTIYGTFAGVGTRGKRNSGTFTLHL